MTIIMVVLSRVRRAWYFMVLFTMLRIAMFANCYLFENTTQCHCVKIICYAIYLSNEVQ